VHPFTIFLLFLLIPLSSLIRQEGLGFRVQGLGFRVQERFFSLIRQEGLGFRVQGLGFRVQERFFSLIPLFSRSAQSQTTTLR